MQHFGETNEGLRSTSTDHAVAGQDDRALGLRDDTCCLLDLKIGWGRGVGLLYFNRFFASDLGIRDVLREIDEAGAWLFRLRDFESLAHDLGDDLRLAGLRCIL